MANLRQTPLTCSGHTRPVVHLAFSDVTESGYYLISACKGNFESKRSIWTIHFDNSHQILFSFFLFLQSQSSRSPWPSSVRRVPWLRRTTSQCFTPDLDPIKTSYISLRLEILCFSFISFFISMITRLCLNCFRW